MDVSDSSHSGIAHSGLKRWVRVGLAGAEAAKQGILKVDMDSLAIVSKLKVFLGIRVGDDKGGVTGALFDIRRGGRDVGSELRRKANG